MSRVICVGSTAKDIFFPMAEGEFFDTPEDVMAQRKVAFEAVSYTHLRAHET